MREIKLTQGKVAIVDDEDFDRLNKFKWYTIKRQNIYYAERAIWVAGKSKKHIMHQMILEPRPGYETDHIDGNGLNNQKENLRYATHQQNISNQRKHSRTSSRFKGVCWHKKAKKWMAHITKDGIFLYLGLFMGEIDAALVYDKAAKIYFGEFARTNFLTEEN